MRGRQDLFPHTNHAYLLSCLLNLGSHYQLNLIHSLCLSFLLFLHVGLLWTTSWFYMTILPELFCILLYQGAKDRALGLPYGITTLLSPNYFLGPYSFFSSWNLERVFVRNRDIDIQRALPSIFRHGLFSHSYSAKSYPLFQTQLKSFFLYILIDFLVVMYVSEFLSD